MTEKHIWENGEIITADLLNGMSEYVDDKVNAIPAGPTGKSAYEVAVAGGFKGTEAEWLASLVGAKGDDAVINITSQADYDALTDKPGVYFIAG